MKFWLALGITAAVIGAVRFGWNRGASVLLDDGDEPEDRIDRVTGSLLAVSVLGCLALVAAGFVALWGWAL